MFKASINIAYGVHSVRSTKTNAITHELTHTSTLYNMAKFGVMQVYKNHWEETRVLPELIQTDLLRTWLTCEETIPESDEDIERINEAVPDGWDPNGWAEWLPVTIDKYLTLMRLPDEVPPFVAEFNIVYWKYYIWNDGMVKWNICKSCAVSKGLNLFYAANYWKEKGWSFQRVEDQQQFRGDEVLPWLIWDENSWCQYCIIGPLWVDIQDKEYSRVGRIIYRKRRYASDSDDDDDISVRTVTDVVGSQMCPNMYKIYRKNKLFKF